jgi:hypothetical protein
LQNLAKARLQVQRIDLDIENTRNAINTEYTQALASYKSNYTNWQYLSENVRLPRMYIRLLICNTARASKPTWM